MSLGYSQSRPIPLPVLQGGTGTTTSTGSGNTVLSASPTLTTPTIGAATATTINGLTLTSSTGTLTIANGKTHAVNNSITLAGTDSTTMTFPSSSDTVVTLGATQTLTNKTLTTPTIVENANPVMSLDGNAVWQYLGYAQITSGASATTNAAISGLSVQVTVPTGVTKVKITGFAKVIYASSGSAQLTFSIWSGATSGALTTQLNGTQPNNAGGLPCQVMAVIAPSAGAVYYTLALSASASTANIDASSTYPAFILIEGC